MDRDRSRSGIKGLDEILNGGFPKNRTIMVAGGPGSAKSTFAMQFLCNGARYDDEPGIYVTLDESPENLISDLGGFNLGIKELVDGGKITFIDLSIKSKSGGSFKDKTDIGILHTTLSAVKEKTGAKRLVIDPITALMISLGTDEIREKLAMCSNLSGELGCTTLITSEIPTGKQTLSNFGVEEFVVDGVIILHHIQQRDVRSRGIEILKMRGTEHGNRIYPMKFTEEGLEVLPEGRVFDDF